MSEVPRVLEDERPDPLMSSSAPGLHWSTTNIGEAAPAVLSPLGWSIWREAGESSLREAGYQLGALTRTERAVPTRAADYFVGAFYGRAALQVEFMALLGDRLPGTSGREVVASLLGRVPDDMQFAPTMRRYPTIAWRLPLTFATFPRRMIALTTEHDRWWRQSVAGLPGLDYAGAVGQFAEACRLFRDALLLQTISALGVVQPLFDAVSRLVARTGVGDVAVLSGSGGAEMAVVSDIWRASRGRISTEAVLANHGFHGPLEGELSSRVWREDDGPLRRMVEQYADRDNSHDPIGHEARRAAAWPAAAREMINAVPRHQRPAVRLLLDLARRRIPMRGAAKRSFLQALDVARGAARRVGDHLVAAGTLSEIDDIFYLTSDELTRAIPNDIAGQTRWRRERRQQYTRLTIPSHWTETPVPVPIERPNATAAIEPAGVLSGIGVSRGVAEGRARVLSSPDFSVVEPDEILVAPTTDPSWSSIMFISRALVVDIGGPLSHAAVVARELEIPCVVNTGTGTQQLRTGDRVRVDGTAGTVEVLDRAVPYEDGYAGLSQGPLDTTAQPDGPVNPYL